METIKQNLRTGRFPQQLSTEFKQLRDTITQAVTVEKIFCFGSTSHQTITKSCFGAEEATATAPKNSYSLLVIPSTPAAVANAELQWQVEEAVKPAVSATVIVHTIDEVNAALLAGSAFFVTVCRKGLLLYDRGTVQLQPFGRGKPIEARITKRERFWNKWHDLATGFLRGAEFYENSGLYHLAIYMLHQAAQHSYTGVLRVMVGYRTNAQNLNRLIRLMDTMVPQLSLTTPRRTPEDIKLCDILSKGFGDARYKETFEVDRRQVAALVSQVSQLIDMADVQCRKRIQQLKSDEIAYIIQ